MAPSRKDLRVGGAGVWWAGDGGSVTRSMYYERQLFFFCGFFVFWARSSPTVFTREHGRPAVEQGGGGRERERARGGKSKEDGGRERDLATGRVGSGFRFCVSGRLVTESWLLLPGGGGWYMCVCARCFFFFFSSLFLVPFPLLHSSLFFGSGLVGLRALSNSWSSSFPTSLALSFFFFFFFPPVKWRHLLQLLLLLVLLLLLLLLLPPAAAAGTPTPLTLFYCLYIFPTPPPRLGGVGVRSTTSLVARFSTTEPTDGREGGTR